MSSLIPAFDFLLSKKFISCQIDRKGSIAAINVQITPTNYSRNKESPENMTQYTNEYVLSKRFLDGTTMDTPRRGDRILLNGKVEIIGAVDTLYGLGDNNLFGWRLRTE